MGLADIVNMPLPTEWAPEYPGSSAAQPFAVGFDPALAASSSVPATVVQSLPIPGAAATGLMVPGANPMPPGGQWQQPFLPNSILPRTLQRNNPMLGRQPVYWQPGMWDARIRRESDIWTWIKAHGGIKSCCRLPEMGSPLYDQPPWMVMPSNAEKIEFATALNAPAQIPSDGNDHVVGFFVVPEGWDGVVTRFVPNFVGTGYTDFSGIITWRLKVNNRYAPDLGNITSTYGSLTAGFSVPGINNIRLISGQTVYVIANVQLGAVVAGYISGIVLGWRWPRR
jgi:hypothetical protein